MTRLSLNLRLFVMTLVLHSCAQAPRYEITPVATPAPPSPATSPTTPGQDTTPTQPLPSTPNVETNARLGFGDNTPSPQNPIKSNWIASSWNDLEAFNADPIQDIWNTLLAACAKPHAVMKALCPQIRAHSLDEESEQRLWLMTHLQPYQIVARESSTPNSKRDIGLLTSYFEPEMVAQLHADETFKYPLFSPPASLAVTRAQGKPWFTRQDIESNSAVQNELKDNALAWLSDPLEVMMIHIQGSARLKVMSPGTPPLVYRLKYAASNDQPFVSMGRWMMEQGLLKDASWSNIRAVLQAHPERAQEAFWSNPRYVFFSLEPMSQAQLGPTGALGLPLLAGRSVAIDPLSVPMGIALWVSSTGYAPLNRMVLSQDTGGAIQGAVRADFFAGTGEDAGAWAAQIKQPLKMWALWPRDLP